MKAAVIGSMNMDKVVSVDHFPKRGETLIAQGFMETFGGKGANQAVAIARLGGDVTMYGCVGDDGDGDRIIAAMRAVGVNMDQVEKVKDTPTGRAFICVGEGDNAIVVVSGANEKVDEAYLKRHLEAIKEADFIIMQNEIPMTSVAWILENLGDEKKIIYNPAPYMPIDMKYLKKATWITPNESEAANLLDTPEGPELQPKCILTRGSKGVAYMEDGHVERAKPIVCKPVDTTGAGDTFNGAFGYGLSQGWSLGRSVVFANTAAGISTEKEGAQQGMPTLEEVERRL